MFWASCSVLPVLFGLPWPCKKKNNVRDMTSNRRMSCFCLRCWSSHAVCRMFASVFVLLQFFYFVHSSFGTSRVYISYIFKVNCVTSLLEINGFTVECKGIDIPRKIKLYCADLLCHYVYQNLVTLYHLVLFRCMSTNHLPQNHPRLFHSNNHLLLRFSVL